MVEKEISYHDDGTFFLRTGIVIAPSPRERHLEVKINGSDS
jgi:hypothetical protein